MGKKRFSLKIGQGLLATILIFQATQMFAQKQQLKTTEAEESITVEEEVVVTGAKSAKYLSVEMRRAEFDMFELFNKLNDDYLFDVTCVRRAVTGSLITRQICTPRYFHEANIERANGLVSGEDSKDVGFELARYQAQFEEKMKEAMLKDPNLAQALKRYNQLKQEFREATSMGNND